MDGIRIDSQAQQILDNIASGCGGSVWWKHRGTKLTPDELRARLVAAGMDPDVVPDIDQLTAVKTCVREFKATEVVNVPQGVDPKTGELVVKTIKKRVRAEVVSKSENEIVIGIFHHVQASRTRASKEQQDTLIWSPIANAWMQDGTSKYAQRLRELISDHQTYMYGKHVRDLVVLPTMRECGGFSAVPGWYYVPTNSIDKLAQLQQVLDGLETFKLSIAAMPKNMGWEENLAEEAEEGLSNDLEALGAQIEGWTKMSRKVRSDTREHIMTRFDALATRAEAYEMSLSVTLEDLRDQITAMRERATEVIETIDNDLSEAQTKSQTAVEEPPAIEVVQTAEEMTSSLREASETFTASQSEKVEEEPEPAQEAELVLVVEDFDAEQCAQMDQLWNVFFNEAPPASRQEMADKLRAAMQ